MASWRRVVSFSRGFTPQGDGDECAAYRPMTMLPVVVWDPERKQRRILPMRWGFPALNNFLEPKHIHIVVMQTFNEGLELPDGKTEQWAIDPCDGVSRGFAFLWQAYEMDGQRQPMLACVMVTVAASRLIAPLTDRMPAILENCDWTTWLGENDATPEAAKAALRTMEGVNWKMGREPVKPGRARPAEEPTLF